MKIKLFGDIWCTEKNYNLSDNISAADLIIANLETPLTLKQTKIEKAGAHLCGTKEQLLQIKSCFSENTGLFFSIANNHIGDYTPAGIDDTETALCEAGIMFSGCSVNNNIEPFHMKYENNTSIDVFSICEKQYGISSFDKKGTNYFSPELYKKINESKRKGNFVIISIHAGAEMNPFPSPYLQELYRSYIDAGADVIHAHHSHVPQGWEEYNHGLIFYGLGNFMVDPERWKETTHTLRSIGVELNIEQNKIISYEIIPCSISEKESSVVIEKEPFNDQYFNDINGVISDKMKLEALWQEFSLKAFDEFYAGGFGYCEIFPPSRKFLKRLEDCIHLLFNDYQYVIKRLIPCFKLKENRLYHFFDCVSHAYAIETALGLKCGDIKDIRTVESKKLMDKYYQSL